MKKRKTPQATSSSSNSSAPVIFTPVSPYNPVKAGMPHPAHIDPQTLALDLTHVPAAIEALMEKIVAIYPGLPADYQNRMSDELRNSLITAIHFEIIMHNDLSVALQILHRLPAHDPQGSFRQAHTPQKVCATALMLGSKYLEDTPFNNESWSRVMGISAADLFHTENALLLLLGYNILDRPTYDSMENYFQQKISACLQAESQNVPPFPPPGPK